MRISRASARNFFHSFAAFGMMASALATSAVAAEADAGQAAGHLGHVNRAISALEQRQPVFSTMVLGGAGYEEGKNLANTKADFVTYEMEHGTFDIGALRNFIRGLMENTPKSAAHVPVIVTLPVLGTDAQTMKANAWVIRQVLATGASGILLAQAESPEAVRIFVESTRYPFAPGAGAKMDRRGFHSEDFAMKAWGTSRKDYLEKADPWPLNPQGDILLGIKIESPLAAQRAEELLSIPGIAFMEWGPGDTSFFLLPKPYERTRDELLKNPQLLEARERSLAAAKKHNVVIMTVCSAETIADYIRDGVKACYAFDDRTIEAGRAAARAGSKPSK